MRTLVHDASAGPARPAIAVAPSAVAEVTVPVARRAP